uniref:Conserved oligomeric Golgi complex subunit 3 n=1 Tax=Parascaris univalens TaxID=6257 RepID=A0A915B293_PARUN
MDNFETLHKGTVQLLTAAVATYALPLVDSDERPEEVDDEDLFEGELYSFLSKLHRDDAENSMDGMCDKNDEVMSLRTCMRRMHALTERYDICSKTMDELRADFNLVTERTSSLHHACDQMMAYQTQIAAGAEQIRANLYYYTQHESIMKKLTSGSINITGQSFTQLLATIDECLTFLRAHMYYKDSALYVAKYEQCLSKALTAIRSGVLADLEASATAVAERQAQLGVQNAYSDDDTFALLYGVFAAKANSVRAALSVAEQRFANVAEFESMAADCHRAYFSIRQQLLTPTVQKTIEQLLSHHADSSCALTRSGCAFLLRLCDDEFRLYKQFFSVAGEEKSSPRSRSSSEPPSSLKTVLAPFIASLTSFDDFIESFCRLFYDVLRPIVIHNPHLETLTELSTILKVEMIEERCGLMMSVLNPQSAVVDSVSSNADLDSNVLNPRSGFVRVMRELVLDIAERIFYRAVLYAESDVANYQPSPGDLAYPEKLVMMNNIAKQVSAAKTNEGPTSTAVATCAVDLNCLWYPTVRRTVICLSKLYNCLYPGVFECLSRELVTACCDSLKLAADQIEKTVGDKSTRTQGLMHAQLFVVKHLLILREQTSPFRSVPSSTSGGLWDEHALQRDYSLDLSKYKTSATQLFHDRGHWFELNSKNAFIEFLFQVPVSISEQLGDFRRIIDARLKSHCHALIENTANMIIVEFADYLNKAEELAKGDVDVKKEALVLASNMQNFVGQAYRKLTHCWPEIRSAFDLYIGAKDTEDILLQPVRKRIVDVFARANVFVEKFYDEEQKQIAGVPVLEQIWLVLNSA